MAILGTFTKQSGEVLDYDIDADSWLTVDDYILTATATETTGITVDSTSIISGARGVKVWVSGGTTGSTYIIQIVMTTNDGRTKEAEFRVKIKDVNV